MGCLFKTSLAKTLLRGKRPGEEKEYTQGYKCSAYCNIHLTEIKFKVGYIPSVRYLFPREMFKAINSSSCVFTYAVWAVAVGGEFAILLSCTTGHSPY